MSTPNVVLILADDMGYGDFGIYNQGLSETPALDSLASEALVLSQHYSASPVCAPARASLLTGRYPHRTGVIDTYELLGLDRLALREVTLADVFKQAGYRTGLVGKWHCGALDPNYHPTRRGFDEFAGFRGGWMDYYQWSLNCNGSERRSDGRYLTDVLTDEAVGFIRRNRSGPFFLHVAYNAPHFPIQAPEEHVKPFIDPDRLTRGVSILYGMIRCMDLGIQRILKELKAQGLEENTIVLFTSDNGPDFGGEGEMCLERFNSDLRGYKTLVYEGGIKVPLLLRWPAGLDSQGVCAQGVCDEFIHLTDWFPTLLAMCGVESPLEIYLDGENVLPILRGGKARAEEFQSFWQWNRFTPFAACNAAVREGEWKLVRPPIRELMPESDPDEVVQSDRSLKYEPGKYDRITPERIPIRDLPEAPPLQLFNLAADPGETEDLSQAQAPRVRRMLEGLNRWFDEVEEDRRRGQISAKGK